MSTLSLGLSTVDSTPNSAVNRDSLRKSRSAPTAYVSPVTPMPVVSPMMPLTRASGIWKATTPTSSRPSKTGVAMKLAGAMRLGR